MLWAVFTLRFFSYMHSGEIGAYSESDFDPTRNLNTQDVAVDNLVNPQILKLRLKCSKTDPFREGADIFLAHTRDELCPVTAMLAWLVKRKAKPAAEGYLFVLQSGGTTDTQQLRHSLQGGTGGGSHRPNRNLRPQF